MDVSPAIVALLSRSRGPDPRNPPGRCPVRYGIAATLDGESLRLRVTFFAGATYCCFEHGCHLDFPRRQRWTRLRRELHVRRLDAPPRMRLSLRCRVEAGALSFDIFKPDRRFPSGWYAFRTEPVGWSYRIRRMEGREADFGDVAAAIDGG